jgi:hypothetical protein
MVDEVEDTVRMLAEADPEAKATLYSALGIRLAYDHKRKVMTVESQPRSWAIDRVGGAYDPLSTPALLRGVVTLKAA